MRKPKGLKDWNATIDFDQTYTEKVFFDNTLIGGLISVRVKAWNEAPGLKAWGGTFDAPVQLRWVGKRFHLEIEGVLSGEIVMETDTAFLGVGAPHAVR